MKIKQICLLLLMTAFSLNAAAQDNVKMQEAFYEAEYFLMRGDYADALPYYQGIYTALPDYAGIAFRIGICYLNLEGSKNKAIEYLEKACMKMTANYKEGFNKQTEAPYEALFFLGDAYRINYMFERASEAYRKYSETLLPDDTENRMFIEQQITTCTNAPAIMASPVKFAIESVGNVINDNKDNYFPVVSSDGQSIVFMSAMKFYDAIMYSHREKGQWSTPVNITPELKSDGDHYASCLSADGKLLILSKDDDTNSDLYTSNLANGQWSPAKKMNKEINTKYWEAHGFISDDGKALIFSSDRPGGFGGLDLYMSRLDASGDWSTPVNMGPEINTPFNEDRPFLTAGGKVLFFASQGHHNMGGYDVFRSDLQENGLWSKPVNIGYPLNTPDDNLFFCPADNGKSGYISLTRSEDSLGKQDIYRITFK